MHRGTDFLRSPGVIDPGVSSYLDILRIIASITVLLSHYGWTLFGATQSMIPGHDAVIVFFVLSGYVIAYVSEVRDRPLQRFVVHRLARIWSVLLPSLALSLVAAILVGQATVDTAPALDTLFPFTWAALKTMLFFGEGWVGSTPAPYNAAVWSLSYEAWYYAIFAAFTFSPARLRWQITAIVALLAGPNIVLLLPCWMLGAWLYYRRATLVIHPALAYVLFGSCLLLFGLAWQFGLVVHSQQWLRSLTGGESYHLRSSTSVINDMLLAPVVAASIIAVQNMPAVNRTLVKRQRITRLMASRTLSIYLFHMPFLAILYGWLGIGKSSVGSGILCIALGIAGCILLGAVTEGQLEMWRRGLGIVVRKSVFPKTA